MPSVILPGYGLSGGPFPIVSGNVWSGQGGLHPIGTIQLRWDWQASGNAYVWLSGPSSGFTSIPTVNSGGPYLSGNSGVGLLDAMFLRPGDPYTIPKSALISGQINIFAACDPAASGVGRMTWEAF